METVKFREIDKEHVSARLPKRLQRRIHKEAFEQKTSISAILSRYVARGMGEDLSEFGLDSLGSMHSCS